MNPEPEPVDLAAQLADIESQPLETRADAFGRLHEHLTEQLASADTDEARQA